MPTGQFIAVQSYLMQVLSIPFCSRLAITGAPEGPQPSMSPNGVCGERLLGKRILIVEDEALLAMEMQFAFEDEGAEVLGPALSLEAATTLVAGTPEIDAAILDVDLGGHDVYPVASLLAARGVPFLFHTGHGSEASLAALFPSAITLTKPTFPDTLVRELRRLASRA